MSDLPEICEGDVIKFYESLERHCYNKSGAWITIDRGYQLVTAKVTGKTAKGRLRLEQCLIYKTRDPKRIAKTTRRPEKLFTSFAQLTLVSNGERGKLLACSNKSTHPAAKGMFNMKAAVQEKPRFSNNLTIYNDSVMRAVHDDTVRERRREQADKS